MTGKSTVSSKRPARGSNGNVVEAFKDLAGDFTRSFSDDLVKGMGEDLLEAGESFFGIKRSVRASGTLSPEETLDITALEAKFQEKQKAKVEPQRKPEKIFRQLPENFIFRQKERQIEQEVEMLLAEIKKEIKRFQEATQTLEFEVAKVVVEEAPPNPGIYHLNFFEWLLGILKTLKTKVENANLWLTAVQSRKAKKGYWSSFKKHGTSFGLSSERVVATQTG